MKASQLVHQNLIASDKWRKSPEGFWKVNVDALLQHDRSVGLGIIIRESRGKVVMARCKKLEIHVEAEIAEGLTCQKCLVLAKEYGGIKIIFYTDYHKIHHTLCSDKEDFSYQGVASQSIRKEVAHLEQVIFSWARRTTNGVAHSLAKLASCNSAFFYYTDAIPNSVLSDLPSAEHFLR
ncbi:hypothetical protein C2S51_017085 [Perilla frutescens var. frutescens]|nr:hypothetical protein C2S51_017085 [Perilla frutescens var. frutescens]